MRLVTGSQMHAIDKLATSKYKIPSIKLMENAGKAVFKELNKLFEKDKHFIVVCGSGNNGGDGFVIARLLKLAGYRVEICFVGNVMHLTNDAETNYDSCIDMEIPFVKAPRACDVLVDAIFGTGLSRDVEGRYAEVISKMNSNKAICVGIDIPSGIDADKGHVLGCAVRCDYTFTLQAAKPGLYLVPGRIYAGKVITLDIGIPKALIKEKGSDIYHIEKHDMTKLLPDRSIQSNKGTYGKVLCVGGSQNMSGAICMAAYSALKSGCGMITCAVPQSIRQTVATNILESMYLPLNEVDGHIAASSVEMLKGKIANYSTIMIGCGITRAKDIQVILRYLLDTKKPLLIDADGLYALKPLLKNYKDRNDLIITPHLKEFSYLVGRDVKEIIDDPMKHALAFCKKYPKLVLVLKSETTLIVKDQKVYINTYGNNGLAKGGSGDVLAGMITGLYAQNDNALDAAVLGVSLHAYSADLLLKDETEYSIIPSEVFKQIDKTIKELRKEK